MNTSKEREQIASELTMMASTLQYWLDEQKKQYIEDGVVPLLNDNTDLYNPPIRPTRGVVKKWVKFLKLVAGSLG